MEQTRDFMIITYNEGRKNYSHKNIDEIVNDIFSKNPLLIFVCTQEASSGNIHFQKKLKKELEKKTNTNKYKILLKFSNIRIGIPGNKNVKTYVYYSMNKCYLSLNHNKYTLYKPIFTSHVTEKIGTMQKTPAKNPINIYENVTYKSKNYNNQSIDNRKYEIIGYGIYNSKHSGLGTIINKTLFKGAIYIRVEIMINGKIVKIICANSHLFFKADKGTGLTKREEQFLSIISEFNFANKLKEGYNIFFCGDLNFRFKNTITKEASLKFSEKMLTILRNEDRIMSNMFSKYSIKNELYDYLERLKNKKDKNESIIEIFNKFKESLDTVGFPLTCRVIEKKNRTIKNGNKENEIKQNEIKEKKNKYRCIESGNSNKAIYKCHKHIELTPSNCDKILFALSEPETIKPINKNNIKLYPTIDLSDHYMMSLSGDFIR